MAWRIKGKYYEVCTATWGVREHERIPDARLLRRSIAFLSPKEIVTAST